MSVCRYVAYIHKKKRARLMSHPKCLHIGIILIVYVIQKSDAKVLLFFLGLFAQLLLLANGGIFIVARYMPCIVPCIANLRAKI